MSGHASYWTDDDTGLTVTVRPLENGRCSLLFYREDMQVSINSTRRSLITASLGARSHFASPDGACEFLRIGDRVRVKVQQWRGPYAEMDLDRSTFQSAIKKLEELEKPPRTEIKLL